MSRPKVCWPHPHAPFTPLPLPPPQGWSRYAQGTKHMAFNSGLFYLRSNERTIDLMRRIADKLRHHKEWDQSVWNEFIFFLSHGDYRSPQVGRRK